MPTGLKCCPRSTLPIVVFVTSALMWRRISCIWVSEYMPFVGGTARTKAKAMRERSNMRVSVAMLVRVPATGNEH